MNTPLRAGPPGGGTGPTTAPGGGTGPTGKRRVFLFINGILNLPGDAEGWTDRAVTWTHIHTDARAEKFEYAAGPLTRLIRQQARAEKFARMLSYYPASEWDVHLVGHSNGCDIILRALQVVPAYRRIGGVHLISAAAEADFDRNGLNERLWDGGLGRVQVYCAGKDWALWLAAIFTGFRFGTLGKTGPANPAYLRAGCVQTIVEPGFGHSTWFEKGQFDRTMELVTGGNIQAPSTKHQIISKDQAPSTGEVPRSNLQKKESRAVADHTPETYRAGSCTAAARALTETWKGKS